MATPILTEEEVFSALRRTWQPVALSSAVPLGTTHGITLLDEEIVVARLDSGLITAPDACPHKGFRLSKSHVCGPELMCAYHGWRFDAMGACTSIPSLPEASINKLVSSGLKRFAVQERYGFIWVQLEANENEKLPELPELEDADWTYHVGPPTVFEAGWRREVENFLDMTHFAFAHAATLGAAATHTLPEMEIRAGDEVEDSEHGPKPHFLMETRFPATQSPHEQPGKLASAHARLYRTWLPNFTIIRQSWPDGDERLLLHVPMPVSRDRCVVMWSLAISPHFDGPPADSQVEFAERVLDEDREMCENQRPREVPINPSRGGWGVLVAPGDLLANAFQRQLKNWLLARLTA